MVPDANETNLERHWRETAEKRRHWVQLAYMEGGEMTTYVVRQPVDFEGVPAHLAVRKALEESVAMMLRSMAEDLTR